MQHFILRLQKNTQDKQFFSLFSEFHDMSGESDKNYESGRRHIKSGGLGSLSFTPNFNGQSENSRKFPN